MRLSQGYLDADNQPSDSSPEKAALWVGQTCQFVCLPDGRRRRGRSVFVNEFPKLLRDSAVKDWFPSLRANADVDMTDQKIAFIMSGDTVFEKSYKPWRQRRALNIGGKAKASLKERLAAIKDFMSDNVIALAFDGMSRAVRQLIQDCDSFGLASKEVLLMHGSGLMPSSFT